MHALIYRSVADKSFVLPEIYGMLSKAKDFNSENGITGCLLYHNTHFLQLLEGDVAEVHLLFEKITQDKRHHEVEIIKEESFQKRLFKDWNMAFHDYGQNGHSANLKMEQLDTFINNSNAFHFRSNLVLPFFSKAKEILFSN